MSIPLNTYRDQSDHHFSLVLRAKLVRGYTKESTFYKLIHILTDEEIINDYERYREQARNRRLQQRATLLKTEESSTTTQQKLISACLGAVNNLTHAA